MPGTSLAGWPYASSYAVLKASASAEGGVSTVPQIVSSAKVRPLKESWFMLSEVRKYFFTVASLSASRQRRLWCGPGPR